MGGQACVEAAIIVGCKDIQSSSHRNSGKVFGEKLRVDVILLAALIKIVRIVVEESPKRRREILLQKNCGYTHGGYKKGKVLVGMVELHLS